MTPEQRRRYGRQIRLAEIGEAGQAALCSLEVSLASRGEHARAIERRYLEAAGARVVGTGDEAHEIVPTLGLRHPEARELAEGAMHALDAIRASVLSAKGNAP